MTPAPEISACFVIGGMDIDPDEVTAAVGLEPTKVWHAPEVTRRHAPDINTVEWQVALHHQRSYSTDEVVAAVLDTIWPQRDRIVAYLVRSGTNASMCCSVLIDEDRPVYELSAESVRRLAALGCEFGLDIFDDRD